MCGTVLMIPLLKCSYVVCLHCRCNTNDIFSSVQRKLVGYNIFVQEKFAERPDGVSAKVRNINNMHSYMCIWVCYACTLLYMCCTCTHRDIVKQMYRCIHASMHTHVHVYTHITQTYTYICTQICTHAHTRAHTRTHEHTHIYVHK